jgi:quinol monooxygenase YgiN
MIMNKFGMYVKFTAQPGKRNELLGILLQATQALENVTECELYIVNTDTDQETVWVTEIWTNEEAHQRSLTLESTKEMIQHAKPLIAGIESTRLTPMGGKGIS